MFAAHQQGLKNYIKTWNVIRTQYQPSLNLREGYNLFFLNQETSTQNLNFEILIKIFITDIVWNYHVLND